MRWIRTLHLLSHSVLTAALRKENSSTGTTFYRAPRLNTSRPVLWGLVLRHSAQGMAVSKFPSEGSGRQMPLWDVGVTLRYSCTSGVHRLRWLKMNESVQYHVRQGWGLHSSLTSSAFYYFLL